jgi:homoserine acetyltransferase
MAETRFFVKDTTLSPQSEPAGAKITLKLAYWTIGSPANPAVLLATCYGGTLASTSTFLYSTQDGNEDPPLPPDKFFIIVVAMLGGGESSSPSNTPAPWNGPNFPRVTYEDTIRLQHALCTEELGIKRLFAYIGFSMGGQQAYHMATLFPDFVDNGICIAGSARTSAHNWSFLEGPRHALIMSHDFHGGNYIEPAKDGVKAFERVYSTWALSQEWFRHRSWEKDGFKTLQDYLEAEWSGSTDANDLLSGLWTWQHGDITIYHPEDEGDLAKALARIQARMLVMPVRTDMYFPPEDNQEEAKHLKNGEFSCIDSIWGHLAGGGAGTKDDTEFIKSEVKRFLLGKDGLNIKMRDLKISMPLSS